MSSDQFEKLSNQILTLYQHMEQRFDGLDHQLQATRDELKTDIEHLRGMVETDLQQRERDEQERLALSRQVDRHEAWIKQMADGSDTRLAAEP